LVSFLRTLVAAGEDRHRRCLFLLDELPSLGKLDTLSQALTQYRKFGLRAVLVAQALAQLQQQFPEGQHATVLAQCDQIYVGIRDYQTAEEVSKRLGTRTAVTIREDGNVGGGTSESGQDSSRSFNWGSSWGESETGQPLLRPEQILGMGTDTAIVCLQNLPPLRVRMCPFYRDNAWAGGPPALYRWERRRCLLALLAGLLLAAAAALWGGGAHRPAPTVHTPRLPVRLAH
jgi:type IV secretion system protein VirD4